MRCHTKSCDTCYKDGECCYTKNKKCNNQLDISKSISEPALAAPFSAATRNSRVDAFVREASSITSLTSSSANGSSKKNKM